MIALHATSVLATMTSLDMGITAAAVLMLLFAARSMFSNEGRAQMGCGFAVVAAVLWSLVLGRRIPDFDAVDGLRLGLGAILLLPTMRALFKHGQGDIVSGALSLVLAFVVAGPVVQRALDHVGVDFARTAEDQLVATDGEIERLEELRAGLSGDLATRRARLAAFGHATSAEVAGDPEAMATLREYARFKERIDDLDERLATLRAERANLERGRAGDGQMSESELDRIRREVTEASNLSDRPVLEVYTEQLQLLELYEQGLKD